MEVQDMLLEFPFESLFRASGVDTSTEIEDNGSDIDSEGEFGLPPAHSHAAPKLEIHSHVLTALKKQPRERTKDDIDIVFDLTSQLEIFCNLPHSVHQQLCKVVRYEKFGPREIVFQIGDNATCFYIILNGLVKVKARDSFGSSLRTKSALSGGQTFGELALIKDTQRTTTVVTQSQTELLSIQKSDYEALKITHERDVEQKKQLLNQIEVFKSWPRNELTKLAYVMAYKKYYPNQVIIKQGEIPTGVFFIKTGKCKLVKKMPIGGLPCIRTDIYTPPTLVGRRNSVDISELEKERRFSKEGGNNTIVFNSLNLSFSKNDSKKTNKLLHIGTLVTGDFFGEIAVLNGLKEEPVSVISEGNVEVFVLYKYNFHKLINGKTLELMKKHASMFPTDDKIKEKYFENKEWENYKKQLVTEIITHKQARYSSANFWKVKPSVT